ncbi:ribosomal protein L22 [Corynespora cassiicola Philippines]|uniref:Ribosomal protein L22 n=1 Tax=Corynespora cassiicola Philippines TaxID=1448308 RepID=A0A2T2NQU8_CORCC|nr:ribosomal protein L22 [Corynespora cassiicola Philippines]
MSARIPSRRLGQSALASFRPSTARLTPFTAARHLSNTASHCKESDYSNPLLQKYFEKKEAEGEPGAAKRPSLGGGKLLDEKKTIFDPIDEVPGAYKGMEEKDPAGYIELLKAETERGRLAAKEREKTHTYLKTDPDPRGRIEWERKKVLQGLKRKGRLTKEVALARTERESLYRSPFLSTSTKKLTRVMHQLAGKTVEEALIQLRFSKKKVALDVMKGLQVARDEAIVGRGMGLGQADAKEVWERARDEGKTVEEIETDPYLADGTRKRRAVQQPKLIELKDGRKKLVADPTEMYIAQAWVGPGEYGKSIECRAQGRMNLLRHRTASFSVLLKEEKTRMRISDEIKKKRDNRKLWQPLPDRPVTTQRQFCLW